MNPGIPIFVLYQIPSFVIMSTILCTLFTTRNPALRGAFFKLYGSNVFCEILWNLCADSLRLTSYAYYAPSVPRLLIFCLFLCHYSYKVMVTGTMLIACNRYSAVVRPFTYQKMWNPRRVKIYIICCHLICALISTPVLLSDAHFVDIGGRLDFVGMSPKYEPTIRNLHISFVFLVTLYGIPKSFLTIRAMAQNKVEKKYERTLVIISTIIYVATFTVLGCHSWKVLTMLLGAPGEYIERAQEALHISMDIHFVISWLIIIASNHHLRNGLRQLFKRCFPTRNKFIKPTIYVSSATPRHTIST